MPIKPLLVRIPRYEGYVNCSGFTKSKKGIGKTKKRRQIPSVHTIFKEGKNDV